MPYLPTPKKGKEKEANGEKEQRADRKEKVKENKCKK